ncbi:MAG: LysM peptidoglycan-binding domain-containing protein [Verrucomicrobiota bacterium]
MKRTDKLSILAGTLLGLTVSFTLSSCDRMMTSRHAQLVKDADTKAVQGDFMRAVNLYEAALDDSPNCAEVHYKLALLYDDKMKDPLNALHHFKRYLVLSPKGAHANEVRDFMKHDEVALITSLSGDSVVTRVEAARLRNENLNLRKELEERSARPGSQVEKTQGHEAPKSAPEKVGGRAYVVRSGDTLVSISRKFYKTPARWKKILDANKKSIDDPEKLKVGQSLTIP